MITATPRTRIAVIVPTHYRPVLLSVVLATLSAQRVLGVDLLIYVVGAADDPGQFAVWRRTNVRCEWIECDGTVADKINAALDRILETLYLPACVLLADDDDLQPPHRVRESLLAIHAGADYVCTRGHLSVELPTGETTHTLGDSAEAAIVGPAWGFSPELLTRIGGRWPDCARGKDRPMLDLIRTRAPDAVFADLTDAVPDIVQLQHGDNLTPRPIPLEGNVWPGRVWQVRGLGRGKWPTWADPYIRSLMTLRWEFKRVLCKPTPEAPMTRWTP